MANVIATIIGVSDKHLCSKNYGSHFDYPSESLKYLKKISDLIEENNATHVIGYGDISFSTFHRNEYRIAVEKELMRVYKQTNGNVWELKGNHDLTSKGMTEYEYYLERGMFKRAENIDIGQMHITMIDNGKIDSTEPNIQSTGTNVVFLHDFVMFEDTNLRNLGEAYLLDKDAKFFGVNYFSCGHIHTSMRFKGNIKKVIDGTTYSSEAIVSYPGCMMRPSYIRKGLDDCGYLDKYTVYDDGTVAFEIICFELLPIEECFNLAEIEAADKKKAFNEEKAELIESVHESVNVSDIVSKLETSDVGSYDPFDIIGKMEVDSVIKEAALGYLRMTC